MLELLLGPGYKALCYRTVFSECDSFTWPNSSTLGSNSVHAFPGSTVMLITVFYQASWTICSLNILAIHCVVAWFCGPQMPVGFSLFTSKLMKNFRGIVCCHKRQRSLHQFQAREWPEVTGISKVLLQTTRSDRSGGKGRNKAHISTSCSEPGLVSCILRTHQWL